MLHVPLAFAWTLWRQHRWGHVMVVGYLLFAGLLSAILPVHISPGVAPGFFGPITLPLVAVAMYLLAVFALGFDQHMGGRESCYPIYLFRLPVGTGALAFWPMAFGAVASVLVWLGIAWFILRPWMLLWNETVPLWWPATLAMAALAWIQALLWSPFGLPWVRVILATFLIPGLVAVANIVPEESRTAIFAGLSGVAWAVGYFGIRHARRGDVPNWEGIFFRLRRHAYWRAKSLGRPRKPFVSAARAQMWFEWRRTGNSLPVMTALVLPFVLLPILLGPNEVIPTARTLLSALAVPVILASLAGMTTSGKNPWVKDYYGVAPFTATLPMSTADLVVAKLKGAALSTLVAWAIVAATVPLAVVLTGNLQEVADWWRQALQEHHPLKLAAGILAAATFLVLWTWKRVVDSLLLGLTGRKWVIQGALFLGMAGFAVLCFIGDWIYYHPGTHAAFLDLLPWLLGLLMFCRLMAAGWALRQVLRRGLLDPRTMMRWLMVWLLLGLVLFGLLAWLLSPTEVPLFYLALAVLLALPMARLAATPLALAWNRHR